ncbi:MAG: XRE family transcriptional regulator [Treponema sp.]|nr:XRE family transcriptional regulator [Treponema sp.]
MKYKSEIFEAIHEDAMADFEVGAISEARLREFDEMCLSREAETAIEAPSLAKMEHYSHVTA